ncbi:hypothetical protein U1Q18_002721 [Sarracenia purpurea var. burkii]
MQSYSLTISTKQTSSSSIKVTVDPTLLFWIQTSISTSALEMASQLSHFHPPTGSSPMTRSFQFKSLIVSPKKRNSADAKYNHNDSGEEIKRVYVQRFRCQ